MALVKRKPIAKEEGNTNNPYGRVYVFELVLDNGTIIHKVGMVNSDSMSRVTDRLMEVLRSFFMQYRYVPHSKIVKAKKYLVPYYVETHMHHLLEELKYVPDKKFDGSNELFVNLDIDEFTEYMSMFKYEELLRGHVSMAKDKYENICAAIREANADKNETKISNELPF